MRRFTESPVHSSLLTVPAAVAIDSVGFDPVGEVMGAAVMQMGWSGYGRLRYYEVLGQATAAKVVRLDRASGAASARTSEVVLGGYRLALSRLVAEATAMQADGIVGITWSTRHLGDDIHEYTAMGTAVRARSRVRPEKPFTTDLDGPDFAALLIGGWVPVALEVAMEMAIRHDDAYTEQQDDEATTPRRTSRSADTPSWPNTSARASARNWRSRSEPLRPKESSSRRSISICGRAGGVAGTSTTSPRL